MPPGAQQQQQPSGDTSMTPVWIMAFLLFAAYVTWLGGHKYIVAFVFELNVLQAKLVHFFTGSQILASEIQIMESIDPNQVNWNQFVLLTRSVGSYTIYPLGVILIILAIWLYQTNITLRFRRTHSMKTLGSQEQHNWPAISPVMKLNLVEADINVGPWAMAQSPMEFARKHQLLRKEDVLLDKNVPGQECTAGLKRGDAKRVFTLQLGPYWDGFDRLPPHIKAIAAIFVGRISREREAVSQLLAELSRSQASGKPVYTAGDALLKKYQNTELVQNVLSQHAYVLTVMASLLAAARDDGVVPSSEFLWLKPIDRRLWYMLNCIGRQTPYAEVGGPFAHWKAEKAMGRPSLIPMIDEAIKALEVAIKEIKLSPKELKELQP